MSHSPAEIAAVLALRTRYLTVVTEDLYKAHNGAAIVRACDCFGVQDIYAINNRNPFQVDQDIAAGADRWVDVHPVDDPNTNNTRSCLLDLKNRGYRIYATSLRDTCIPLSEVALDQPLAMCFGSELEGLSNSAHDLADAFVRLPMYGFTQSLNISVCMAISLFELTSRLRASDWPWPLSKSEQDALALRWQACQDPL